MARLRKMGREPLKLGEILMSKYAPILLMLCLLAFTVMPVSAYVEVKIKSGQGNVNIFHNSVLYEVVNSSVNPNATLALQTGNYEFYSYAHEGYVFSNMYENDQSIGYYYTVETASASYNIDVYFTESAKTVNVSIESGTGTASLSKNSVYLGSASTISSYSNSTFQEYDTYLVETTPATGYNLSKICLDAACNVEYGAPTMSDTIFYSNVHVYVYFAQTVIPTLLVERNSGEGWIGIKKNNVSYDTLITSETAIIKQYAIGDSFTLTAVPSTGYQFDGFCPTLDCSNKITTNPYTNTIISNDQAIYSYFSLIPTATPTPTASPTVTPTVSPTATPSPTPTPQPTPNPGCTLTTSDYVTLGLVVPTSIQLSLYNSAFAWVYAQFGIIPESTLETLQCINTQQWISEVNTLKYQPGAGTWGVSAYSSGTSWDISACAADVRGYFYMVAPSNQNKYATYVNANTCHNFTLSTSDMVTSGGEGTWSLAIFDENDLSMSKASFQIIVSSETMITLTSYPSSAGVYVNGVASGITPVTINANGVTNFTFKFVKNGYQNATIISHITTSTIINANLNTIVGSTPGQPGQTPGAPSPTYPGSGCSDPINCVDYQGGINGLGDATTGLLDALSPGMKMIIAIFILVGFGYSMGMPGVIIGIVIDALLMLPLWLTILGGVCVIAYFLFGRGGNNGE